MKYFYYKTTTIKLTNWASHVPSRTACFHLSFKILLLMLFCFQVQTITCNEPHRRDSQFNNNINNNNNINHFLPQTSYLDDELSLYDTTIAPNNALLRDTESNSWRQSTPPLSINRMFKRSHREDATNQYQYLNNYDHALAKQQLITPDKVLDSNYPFFESTADIFSPIFNFQSAKPQFVQQDAQSDSANSFVTDTSNLLDIIESGSGAGWPESAPFDENSHRQDESTISNNEFEIKPSVTILPDQMITPTFAQMPVQTVGDKYDHAPVLARRLPKLVATVGRAWHYTIPSDTFQDEDGDLRELNTSLLVTKKNPNSVHQVTFLNRSDFSPKAQDKFFHWLQYDQNTQTMRGFPTENDAGRYFYTLVVSDHLGFINNETIEIAVRQHQSSRAFTHLFTLSGSLDWINMKYQSLADLLIDFSKRIGDEIYADGSSENVLVRSYSLEQVQSDKISDPSSNSTVLMTLSWSNSSLSVNHCEVEQTSRALIDERYLNSSWSMFNQDGSNLVPSQSLVKALSPEFKPTSLSLNFEGVCLAGANSFANDRQSFKVTPPETKTNRIGRLKWKLGQPIIYKFSDEIFLSSNRKDPPNLSMSLHTIDGLDMSQDPKYDFLEFDHESKTVFGLPYDILRHTGQRELLLTANVNNQTNQVMRETFIIDIEAQDLTTINNRAFRMVLYFMARTNMFGPREQVHLSRRMVNALDIEDLNFYPDQKSPQFTVINIQKFNTGSSLDNSASLSDPANTWRYQDKIHLVDDISISPAINNYTGPEGSFFYKLTWTNETIGYRGDCPVEVIKDNILYALERSMIDYVPPLMNAKAEDPSTNDSVRFYERLKSYFEPELDLIHLRFEPTNACIDALELHDVGNSDIADLADKASEFSPISEQEISPNFIKTSEGPKVKEISPINSDEYWAIVVLIILVVAIIFVVMMLFMGLHTYRINQEKRFELQMKLAQARQNSMYLSSLVLSDQVRPSNFVGQNTLTLPGTAKSMYIEESSSRKPIILDNEKQFMANGHIEQGMHKPTTVQLMGQTINTTPLKPNMTFTLDSIANLQHSNLPTSVGPETMMANQLIMGNPQRSMTLNRRPTKLQNHLIGRQSSMSQLSQSQSILTVASIGQPTTMLIPNSQNNIPFMYTPLPISHDAGGGYISQDGRAI